jgi:transposase
MANDSEKIAKRHYIRGSRDRVRQALFMFSIGAIRSNDKAKHFYKRLRTKGKHAKVALTAVARKMFVILNSNILAKPSSEKFQKYS